jgi:hypothetical protein
MVTPPPPRMAIVIKLLARIGPAEALGAVVIWIRADAAAQRTNVLTLISLIDTPFTSLFFNKLPRRFSIVRLWLQVVFQDFHFGHHASESIHPSASFGGVEQVSSLGKPVRLVQFEDGHSALSEDTETRNCLLSGRSGTPHSGTASDSPNTRVAYCRLAR